MAAELIEAGVDVDDTYRRLYERVPIEKLRLVARALEKIERFDDGRLAVTYISRRGLRGTGAERGPDRGDHRPRARARGHRGRRGDPRQDRRRPRRAQGQPALDRRRASTSRRSPASTAAAGTSGPPASRTDLDLPRAGRVPAVPRSRAQLWLTPTPGAGPAASTSRRGHLARRGRRACAASAAPRAGHAGTLDPFATGLLIVLLGRAATRDAALPPGAAARPIGRRARLGSRLDHRRPRRRAHRDRASRERARAADRASPPAAADDSAVKVGGERAYRRAHRGEERRDCREREVEVHRAELLCARGRPRRVRDRVLVRAPTCAA